MIKVGDRVKVIKMRQYTKELIQEISKYTIEVVGIHNCSYCIKFYGVLDSKGDNFTIEYYRNLKIENILN
jgi:hypothetical protein